MNIFYGDLVDKSRSNISIGVVAERELSTYLSGRLQLMGGQMSGEQTQGDAGGIFAHFKNTYTDFSVGASFKPLNLLLGYYKQRAINPYVIGQVGMAFYSATEYFGDVAASISSGINVDDEWRSYSSISPIVSGGFGISYWINSQWSINIEGIGTLPFSDEMDAHSEWYDLKDHPNPTTMYQTDANDFYYTATVGVTFLINDSRWKNEPKYNRKAYLKTRDQMRHYNKKNLKSIKRRRKKR
jgi:hypothetical protein